jgi:hypothetical protein
MQQSKIERKKEKKIEINDPPFALTNESFVPCRKQRPEMGRARALRAMPGQTVPKCAQDSTPRMQQAIWALASTFKTP